MIKEITIPVLKRKKYGLVALIATFIMASVSYYLTIVNVAFHSFSVLLQMDGWKFTVISLGLSLIISALFGAYLGLFIFRHDLIKSNKNARYAVKSASVAAAKPFFSGIGGAFTGVVAAACPGCGAPILAFFGAPLALMALPFQGLEIKVLSVLLLLLSVYLLAESIEKKINC
jgi:hypothetical protein